MKTIIAKISLSILTVSLFTAGSAEAKSRRSQISQYANKIQHFQKQASTVAGLLGIPSPGSGQTQHSQRRSSNGGGLLGIPNPGVAQTRYSAQPRATRSGKRYANTLGRMYDSSGGFINPVHEDYARKKGLKTGDRVELNGEWFIFNGSSGQINTPGGPTYYLYEFKPTTAPSKTTYRKPTPTVQKKTHGHSVSTGIIADPYTVQRKSGSTGATHRTTR